MESQRNQDSEINLADVFKDIVAWFKSTFWSILLGIATLRQVFLKHLLFFVVLEILSLAIVVGQTITKSSEIYSSSMIIKCDYINMRILRSSIEKLNLLCKEDEREGLSKILKIPQNTAKNIVDFNATQYVSEDDRLETELLKDQLINLVTEKKTLVEKVIKKIELGNVHSFQITITIKNPDIVSSLDSALVNFFRNNEYVSKRIESHKKLKYEKREKLVKELNKLDSLKAVIFETFRSMATKTREGSNNVILGDKPLTDPINVFRQDLLLYSELQLIDEELQIRPDFEIIDGLTTFLTPSNFKLSVRLIIAFAISTVTGFLLLGLWNFNKYLASLTKQD